LPLFPLKRTTIKIYFAIKYNWMILMFSELVSNKEIRRHKVIA